jgi:hypothetical protein
VVRQFGKGGVTHIQICVSFVGVGNETLVPAGAEGLV